MPLNQSSKPILVTGANRSGTTWIGQTIAYSRNVGFMNEVFNPSFYNYSKETVFQHYFAYITDDNAEAYLKELIPALRFKLNYRIRKARPAVRLQRLVYSTTYQLLGWPRPLLKDPIAAMSAEWLARQFNMDVVVMLRHPGAFVHSMKRLGWRFDYQHFLEQPALVADWLHPFEAELRRQPDDLIEESAVLWKCTYHVLNGYIQRNPGWIVKRHEDVSLDPVEQFRDLYARLGLAFTHSIQARIEKATAASNPEHAPQNVTHHLQRDSRALVHTWKQTLDEGEIQRIRELTEPVAGLFYQDEDW